MRLRKYLIAAAVIIAMPGWLRAGGSDTYPLFSARTIGLNGLYFAGSDGVNSLNPAAFAGLTGMGLTVSGADLLNQQEFDGSREGLFRAYKNDNIGLAAGFFWNIRPGFTAAVTYQPYINYEVDWPFTIFRQQDSNAVILAFDMTNRIQANAISPSVAFSLGNLSLGLSANVYHVSYFNAFPLQNERSTGDAAYQMEYDQSAWTFGFTLGAMADVTESMRLGLMVKSGFKAKLKGTAKSNMFAELDSTASQTDVSSTYQTPWVAGLGLVYKLTDNMAINADVAYSMWGSTQKTMNFTLNNSFWQNGLNYTDSLTGINPSGINLNYRNTLSAGVGFEYTAGEGMAYRFGYKFSQSPNSDETYSMLFPGVDEHWFSFGIGYKDEGYTVDASVAYALGVSKNVSSGQMPALAGKYKSNGIYPAVSIHFAL
ncbi:MAG TPA: outer membrane protein transport protein [Ignavibacteriales bacterium]|nr:outer membrane protein transport protein [Ignavibacteriales bacterium]